MASPIVYITHDITTAYHVADEVLVLYRGHVVERGDAAEVIGNPQHPTTRSCWSARSRGPISTAAGVTGRVPPSADPSA